MVILFINPRFKPAHGYPRSLHTCGAHALSRAALWGLRPPNPLRLGLGAASRALRLGRWPLGLARG